MRTLFGPIVLVVALASSAGAAPPAPADLLPAGTLISLEVHHPDKLAAEVRGLVEKTALGDAVRRAAKMRAETPGDRFFFGPEPLALIQLFLSPPTLAEAGRLQGAALAVTGLAKNGEPEIVFLLHAGDSNLPGFFLRGETLFTDPRLIEEAEGVGIYRKGFWNKRPEGKAEWEGYGPHFAALPGVVVFTSSAASAKDVILRAKGKGGPSLASTPGYRDAAVLREKPSLSLAVDVTALTAALDAATKDNEGATRSWQQVKQALEPRAVKRLDAGLTLTDGDLDLAVLARLDPAFTSPLLQAVTAKPLKLGSLAGVPADSWFTLTLGGGDPAEKLAAALRWADVALGEEGAAAKQLPAFEQLLGLRLAQDVFGRIAEVTLTAQLPDQPILVIQATDDDAAKYLYETALTRLASAASGRKVESTVEKVGDQEVRRYPFMTVTGARVGSIVLLGSRPEDVASHLQALAKRPRKPDGMPAAKDAELLATVAPRGVVHAVLTALFGIQAHNAITRAFRDKPTTSGEVFLWRLGTNLDAMGPVVLRGVRADGTLKIQGRLTGLRAAMPKVLEDVVNDLIEIERERRQAPARP